jgi:IclR family acetate operon transcriptional repressor
VSRNDPDGPARPNGVQSLSRALDLLEVFEAAGGILSISEAAIRTELSLPTAHRLTQGLASRGYLRQLPDRRYCLGSRLVGLGSAADSLLGRRARPVLQALAEEVGESANLAVLSGDRAEYVSQAPGSHSMRMFTQVGRRVALHCTGVGKALLSMLEDGVARQCLERTTLTTPTPSTLSSVEAVLAELTRIRSDGYAVDEGEMEVGVRCVAVPVPTVAPMAVSVSGPTERMSEALIERTVPLLRTASRELAGILTDA